MPNVSFIPHAAARVSAVLAQLKDYLGDKVSTNQSVCEAHSHGEALELARLPAAVVFAETTEDVSTVLAYATGPMCLLWPLGWYIGGRACYAA